MKTKRSYKKIAFILMIVLVATTIPMISIAGDDPSRPEGLPDKAVFKDKHCRSQIQSNGTEVELKYRYNETLKVWEVYLPSVSDLKAIDPSAWADCGHNACPTDVSSHKLPHNIVGWSYNEGDQSTGDDHFTDFAAGEWHAIDAKIHNQNGQTIIQMLSSQSFAVFEKNEEVVSQFGSVKLTKTDDSEYKIPLVGAIFELFDSNGDSLGQVKTKSEGIVSWSNLTPGAYTLKEIKAAEGYDETTFTINGTVIDENGYLIRINNYQYDFVLEATNRLKRIEEKTGSIILIKRDAANADILLSGAIFSLETSGEAIATAEAIDGVASWSGLKYGEYTISELSAAAGYDLSSFILFQAGTPVVGNVVSISDDTPDLELIATNTKKGIQGKTDPPIKVAGETATDPKTLGENADPFKQKVLGEEARTADTMNVMLMVFFLLAAVAVIGGVFAQRRIAENKRI